MPWSPNLLIVHAPILAKCTLMERKTLSRVTGKGKQKEIKTFFQVVELTFHMLSRVQVFKGKKNRDQPVNKLPEEIRHECAHLCACKHTYPLETMAVVAR